MVVLVHAPRSWPRPATAAVVMVLLGGLDLLGAFAAKEAASNGSLVMAGFGVALSLVLFWIYASSLQYADLAPVTFGWIVVLQVGILLLDRFRYDALLPAQKWVAIGVVLVAQGYLVLAPTSPAGRRAGRPPRRARRPQRPQPR